MFEAHEGPFRQSHRSSMTTLIDAARRGDSEILKSLIDSKADLDAADDSGRTALMWAAANGDATSTKLLIDAMAHVHARDNTGATALWMAAFGGHVNCMQLLVDANAGVNVRNNENTRVDNCCLAWQSGLCATATRFTR